MLSSQLSVVSRSPPYGIFQLPSFRRPISPGSFLITPGSFLSIRKWLANHAGFTAEYLLDLRHDNGAAIVILILYFILFLFMIASYLRTMLTITFDCGVVPLGPLAIERRRQASKKGKTTQGSITEGYPYYAGPDLNPDSPGLEQFYHKDVFVCESDGRPKWCSECCNWKPDRAHHSSEVNRCVYRMDHYCPWVGGMIGENSKSWPGRNAIFDRT